MSIFDVFSVKSAFQKIFTTDNITALKTAIKEKIIDMVKSNIPGQEKMDAVVEATIEYIEDHLSSSNSIVQWCIDKLLIPAIRTIAQGIYDDLKEIVEGL